MGQIKNIAKLPAMCFRVAIHKIRKENQSWTQLLWKKVKLDSGIIDGD